MKFKKQLLCIALGLSLVPGASALAEDQLPKDVSAEAWYYDAAKWAYGDGVLRDESAFLPEETVTRAQAVTSLWRMAGEPAPSPAVTETFPDVASGSDYAPAVQWAVSERITNGMGDGFYPDAPCSRAQMISLLHRYMGSPAAEDIPFTDVAADKWCAGAVAWGCQEGVITEMNTGNGGLFRPSDGCSRSEMVSFLYETHLAGRPGENGARVYENGGLQLQVPAEYAPLVLTETPKNADNGVLFTVSEKASVEAAKAQGEDGDPGAGWLFSIGSVSEEKLHEMLCSDMSGEDVFARDAEGKYWIFYHPTDVRLVRESYDDMEEDMKQWSALNEWAASVKESFIASNSGLSAETRGNSTLDMYLARTAYMDDVKYTLSTVEHGPQEPGDVDAAPYVEKLTRGVTLDEAKKEETPDGEYVVLNFPDDDVRFDFFLMEGKENYIRQTWAGDNEMLYKATFADGETKASAVMSAWYQALVEKGASEASKG